MFKKIINTCLLVCLCVSFSFGQNNNFKAAQLKGSRVKAAYTKKWPALKGLLKSNQIDPKSFEVYIRIFKQEDELEIWVKDKAHRSFLLLKTISICAKSGSPGPKRKEGDGQVPEGFYTISAFNPYSSYHLSLKVSYPNKSDLLKTSGRPGGDIMIHGNCVTIGCIPIENDPIEELYVLCVEVKNRGKNIPTDIYPYKFTSSKSTRMEKNQSEETLRLWSDLKKAYSYFELNHILPKIAVDKKGNYTFDNSIN